MKPEYKKSEIRLCDHCHGDGGYMEHSDGGVHWTNCYDCDGTGTDWRERERRCISDLARFEGAVS